jgi:hypothetical protein
MTEEKKKNYVGLSGNIQMKSGMTHLPKMTPQDIIDDFSKQMFGITMTEARKKGVCISCQSPHTWTEGELAGLCKECNVNKKD